MAAGLPGPEPVYSASQQVGSFRINHDLVRYRRGYPGEPLNDMELDSNLKFYQGKIKSRPNGDFIDEIHRTWAGDYRRLEQHHGYIQWLFPLHEDGVNMSAQARIRASYEMMLDFYGARLVDWDTGELARGDAWRERFSNLCARPHNFLRITRILKCLGEVGLERLKKPLLLFLAREALLPDPDRALGAAPDGPRAKTAPALASCARSLRDYWAATLRSDEALRELLGFLAAPRESESVAGAAPAQSGVKRRTRSDGDDDGSDSGGGRGGGGGGGSGRGAPSDEDEWDPDSVALR